VGPLPAVMTAGPASSKAGRRQFLRGGVGTGCLPGDPQTKRPAARKGSAGFATGTSMVLHHATPMLPTVHLNYLLTKRGRLVVRRRGVDLTPFYPFLDDANPLSQQP